MASPGTITNTTIVANQTNEINQEKTLDTAMQRAINKSRAGKLITNYLSSQPERFFNSLVIAVEGGDPRWIPAPAGLTRGRSSRVQGEACRRQVRLR